MWKRTVSVIIICASALFLPFPVTAACILVAFFLFPWFFEGLAILFFIDMIFGAPIGRFFYFPAALSLLGLIALLIVEFMKTRLSFYHA